MNFRKLKDKIGVLWYGVQNVFERAKKGYCDRDLWDIRDWFTTIMPKMIDDFEVSRHGYPGNITDEEWTEILKQISYYFRESNINTCSQKNEIEYDCKINFIPIKNSECYTLDVIYPTKEDEEKEKLYLQKERELEKYREDCFQKGIELFSKYIDHLWD